MVGMNRNSPILELERRKLNRKNDFHELFSFLAGGGGGHTMVGDQDEAQQQQTRSRLRI